MEENFAVEAKCVEEKTDCPTVSYQDVNVCVPITIKAYGEMGKTKTKCLGKAIISCECGPCKGKSGDECKYTICQNLRVEVPVTFGAKAEAGKAFIEDCCG